MKLIDSDQEAILKAKEWENLLTQIGSKTDSSGQKQLQAYQKQNLQLVLAIKSKEDNEKLEDKDEMNEMMYNLKQINIDDFKK